MNQPFARLGATLAIVGAASSVSHAQDYQAYTDLLARQASFEKVKDFASYESFLAPNYSMTAPDGKIVTRAQALEMYRFTKSDKGKLTFTPAPRTIDSVSITGDEGIVFISTTAIYKQKDTAGTLGPKDQEHEWNIAQTNRYTWTRTTQGWKLKSLANTGVKRLIDGKPFPRVPPVATNAAPAAAAVPLPPLDKNSPFRDVPRTDPAYADVITVTKPWFRRVVGYPSGRPAIDYPRSRMEFAVDADRALRRIVAMPDSELRAFLRQHPDILPALTRLLTTFEGELRTLGVDFEAAKATLDAKVKAATAEAKAKAE